MTQAYLQVHRFHRNPNLRLVNIPWPQVGLCSLSPHHDHLACCVIHFVPTTFWLGRRTKCHTLFLVKLLSSSCIATTQSGSLSASSILYGSIEDTKEKCSQKMSNSRSSGYPLVNVTKYGVDGVISLNCLVDSWVWLSLILNF